MRNEYDFSKSRKNPYANQLKRQITIRLDTMAVNYFKEMAAELAISKPNQSVLVGLRRAETAPRHSMAP